MQGNLVGPEDVEDSDVEMAPDDQELNYGERHIPGLAADTLAVFNHHHNINSLQVKVYQMCLFLFCFSTSCLLD